MKYIWVVNIDQQTTAIIRILVFFNCILHIYDFDTYFFSESLSLCLKLSSSGG